MNTLQRAYAEGVKLAESAHGVGKLVAPGAPKAQTPSPSTTMTKSPSAGGMLVAPRAAPAPFAGGSSSRGSLGATSPSVVGQRGAAAPSPFAASELAKQTASQMANQNVTNTHFGSTQAVRVFGADPRAGSVGGSAGPAGGVGGVKAGEFNMGMTPDPASKPDKTPAPDNGHRMMGNRFNDPQHPLNDISSAWNAQSIPKNTDVLNEAGQMEVGAPRG